MSWPGHRSRGLRRPTRRGMTLTPWRFLVGGVPRLAAVAVAGLVPSRVRVDRKGYLSLIGPAGLSTSFGAAGSRPTAPDTMRVRPKSRGKAGGSAAPELTSRAVDTPGVVSDAAGLLGAPGIGAAHGYRFESTALQLIGHYRGNANLAIVAGKFGSFLTSTRSLIGCLPTACSFGSTARSDGAGSPLFSGPCCWLGQSACLRESATGIRLVGCCWRCSSRASWCGRSSPRLGTSRRVRDAGRR